ncbi:uncharacterized protein LOC119107440 [Pollicipes pollicipes]|uniref:uncharacterized protein LOC119107440 n=1 Tax=Pollicipes pollicipes TaxID=41117 RepID=UPI0018856D83|nr:uncharacterized protein LOC119107440 [Pollicipes pollicipes]
MRRKKWSLFQKAATAAGTVIAPPWVNVALNPCSASSWQLVHWPADGRCYPDLPAGALLADPGADGELLTFSRATHEPVCGCSRRYMARTYWPHTDSCYQQMTRARAAWPSAAAHAGLRENYDRRSGQCYPQGERGPCPPGNVFAFNNVTGSTECRCPADSLVLPDTGACHRAFAQGPCKRNRFVAPRPEAPHQGVCVTNPCRRGELYFSSRPLVQYEEFRGISYRGACGCTKHFTQNFWPADGRCYEQQTRGPCPARELFAYNATSGRTDWSAEL